MGVLIPMSAFSGHSRRAIPAGESAEILFFTGVRYYRMPDAIEPEAAKPLRTAKIAKTAKVGKTKKVPAPVRLDCHA